MKIIHLAAVLPFLAVPAFAQTQGVTSSTDVRSGPAVTFDIVATLEAGTAVSPTACQDDWCNIGEGWIPEQALGEIPDAPAGVEEVAPSPQPTVLDAAPVPQTVENAPVPSVNGTAAPLPPANLTTAPLPPMGTAPMPPMNSAPIPGQVGSQPDTPAGSTGSGGAGCVPGLQLIAPC